jgi:hypothetical protein
MSANRRLSPVLTDVSVCAEQRHQAVVAHLIEERLQVQVHHMSIPAVHVGRGLLERLMGAPVGSDPVAALREDLLVPLGENLADCLLDQTIPAGGNA